jgi:3-hydroxyacyl-CoA dehydrogenase
MIMKILVIGSGIMGCGIAQIFAKSGHRVVLNDLNEEILAQAQGNIRNQLDIMAQN